MKKIKMLIADDEELLQDLYEMILESDYICESVKVSNGLEAIAALKTHNDFDLIISDYNMPNSNGGAIYTFNKSHNNHPFFLFSGGGLQDYCELNDFHKSNRLNRFFNKPFDHIELLDAVNLLQTQTAKAVEETIDVTRYIKVKLAHYIKYTASTAEVYIKLSDDKFTKIINANPENLPDIELLKHYLTKEVPHVYVKKEYFSSLMLDVFNHFHKKLIGEKKAEALYEVSGFKFKVCYEALNDVGISNIQIERTNEIIEETVKTLLDNTHTQEHFKKLCDDEGFAIGHSMLIMYIAGRICHEANLNFVPTMKKICAAAFYHDLSLFEFEAQDEEMTITKIDDPKMLKLLLNHPAASAEYLPQNTELIEETKRIILEHHEMPTGDGYPKKLTATQIAPLSALFILSQQITFCLIRNNFSKERLRDFLTNSEATFSQGNFSKFYKACETIFVLNT